MALHQPRTSDMENGASENRAPRPVSHRGEFDHIRFPLNLLCGFAPSPTYSAHWIRHPGLAAAIEDYCQREAQAQAAEITEMAKVGPYRSDNGNEDD